MINGKTNHFCVLLCFIYMYIYRDVLFEFHLKFWNTASMVFQLEVYYKVDKLLTGLTAQQKGTTARWYSNKTSLAEFSRDFLGMFRIEEVYFVEVSSTSLHLSQLLLLQYCIHTTEQAAWIVLVVLYVSI